MKTSYLIYSLVFIIGYCLLFSSSIRKHSKYYYSLAWIVAIATTVYELFRLFANYETSGIMLALEKASMKGSYSIAFFTLVMFAGVLDPKSNLRKKLLSIRAETAILGSILLVPHCIMYAVRFTVKFIIPKQINAIGILVLLTGLIAFIVMIPLFITSFKKVRKKMTAANWKKLQRWAYLFYALSYIHIVVYYLFLAKELDIFRLSVYTLIFGGYFGLKLVQVAKSKANKKSENTLELEV